MRIALAVLLLAGCGDAGPPILSYPAVAVGASGPLTASGWEVTLEVARVAFGPAYFCATEAASPDLCPTAVNELATVAAFDALSATPQPLGDVRGVPGALRSVHYDFGITWFTRQTVPTPAAAAPEGHSAHFEGRARKGPSIFRFVADVDVTPSMAGTRVVSGARVTAEVHDSSWTLTVALDPRELFAGVDFDELSRQPGDPVAIAPGSRAASEVVVRLMTIAAPKFKWSPIRNP